MKSIKDILNHLYTENSTVLQLYQLWDHNQDVSVIRLLKEAAKLGLIDIAEAGDRIADHIVFISALGTKILKDKLEMLITNDKEHVSKLYCEDPEEGSD